MLALASVLSGLFSMALAFSILLSFLMPALPFSILSSLWLLSLLLFSLLEEAAGIFFAAAPGSSGKLMLLGEATVVFSLFGFAFAGCKALE